MVHYVTVREAARLANVTLKYVYDLIAAKRISALKDEGKYRLPLLEVQALADKVRRKRERQESSREVKVEVA